MLPKMAVNAAICSTFEVQYGTSTSTRTTAIGHMLFVFVLVTWPPVWRKFDAWHYWRHATVCYTHYGSCAVMASQSLRYMMSFVLPSSRSWPTAHHRGPVHALPPTVLSWSHSSADARDLRTAAVKCQHTVILLMKLTILFSVESCLTKDMFYSLSRPTVIPSVTVWENDRIIRHYWTKAHILITMTF